MLCFNNINSTKKCDSENLSENTCETNLLRTDVSVLSIISLAYTVLLRHKYVTVKPSPHRAVIQCAFLKWKNGRKLGNGRVNTMCYYITRSFALTQRSVLSAGVLIFTLH